MRPLTLVALLVVWSSGAAQAEDNEKLDITVVVDPIVAVPAAMVKVSGKTVALGNDPVVKISFVVDPSADHADKAPTQEATAKVTAKGDYSATVRMEAQGHYNVNVIAPDGKGTATTLFILLDPPETADELETSFVKLGDGLQKQIESLKTQLAGIPANPARLETEEKLGKVETKMKDFPAQAGKLKAAVAKIVELPKKYPEAAAALHPRLQALADVASKNKEEQAKIDQEVEKSRAAGATCEKLDQTIESLKQLRSAVTFVQDSFEEVAKAIGLETAADKFTAFVTPKSLEGNTAFEFAVKEATKAAATIATTAELGPVGFMTEVVAKVVDVQTFVVQQNFDKYCEKLEGPISATMHAQIKQEEATWWTYDIALQGRLTLRYAKGAAPGAAVHVSGEFIGAATRLDVWENALAVLYPVTQKTSTLLRKLVIPPGGSYSEQTSGREVTGFNVPVEGDIVKDTLTLTLGEARSDLSDVVEAHVTYVLIGPMILAPIIVKYDLPFTKAQKLLFRAMNDGPVEIPVKVTSKTMTLAKAFTRNRPGQGNVVDYTLNIKACNPGCK